ncbi:MAG: alpha-galactosidase [Pseudomonadota bacterium]
MASIASFYTLHSNGSSLVLDCRSNAPAILYWGSRLYGATQPSMIALLKTRQEAQARVQGEPLLALSPEIGAGFLGTPGIQIHRAGQQWNVYSQMESVQENGQTLTISSACKATGIRIVHILSLDSETDVLQATTEVTNLESSTLWINACNAPCIPLPMDYDQILAFEGRWSNEFQLQKSQRLLGAYVRENRRGRTSHDAFPGVMVHPRETNESAGDVYALHLGWSGNHRLAVEERSEGRSYAQLGELLFPGEMSLESGESYVSPKLFGVHSANGFSGASRQLHGFVREHLTDVRMKDKLKRIHFNTWEAVYFDLTMDKLCELADEAADIGVERFVLDDGWFKGRNSEDEGLGDWYVDEAVFPEGLTPLIEYVNGKGMEFGLWLEPEMVNPKSDLYRNHPDWVLDAKPAPQVMTRNQLVLDLTRVEVQEYLFERIDSLLSEYSITYLKWDMNRSLNQPGGESGRAVTHYQTLALYKLLDRVRVAHPMVEIESCASGGGRADYGILRYTDRVWTSDTNDALDRLRVQRGFSYFFPPEFMGAHVGPEHCHVTGRRLSMALRAGVSFFGDMGVEANLLELSEEEKRELCSAIELHKKHRALLFSGDNYRLELPMFELGFGVVSPDKSEALFSYALIQTPPRSAPGVYRFKGLKSDTCYEIRVVWPEKPKSYSRSVLDVLDGAVLSGDVLMTVGTQLPILMPESLLIFHLHEVDA